MKQIVILALLAAFITGTAFANDTGPKAKKTTTTSTTDKGKTPPKKIRHKASKGIQCEGMTGKGKNAKFGTIRTTIEREMLLGVPAYLAGVMSCIDRRCKILGLDAPVAVTVDWRKEAEQAGYNAGELFEQLVNQIAAVTSSAESVDE